MNAKSSKRWIWCLAALAALVVLATGCLCLVSFRAAADPEYELVLYDGDTVCAVGNVDNRYCYAVDTVNMVRRYTFTYHDGINIRLGATTQTGENIAWQPAEMMATVKRDAEGAVADYTVSGIIDDTIYTYKIRIAEKTLNVVWDEDSMTSEYGQRILPKVTLQDPKGLEPNLSDLAANVTYVVANDPNRSEFTAEYVADIGCGTYTVAPVFRTKGNYKLADTTHTYAVTPYSGAIVVDSAEASVVYDGSVRSSIALLGASVQKGGVADEGYRIEALYSLDGENIASRTDQLATAGRYYVAFSFVGTAGNYANPRCPASGWYPVEIRKADVVLSQVQSPLGFEYKKNRTAESAAVDLYNARRTYYDVKDADGRDVDCAPADFEFAYRKLDTDEWSLTPPAAVGSYTVRVHYKGNVNYNATEDDLLLPLEVVKCSVGISWKAYAQQLSYGERFDLGDGYVVDSDDFAEWIEEGNTATYTLTYEYSRDCEHWSPYALSAELPMPGFYRAMVIMDSELYCGQARRYAEIDVAKVALTAEDVRLDNLSVTYGERAAATPVTVGDKTVDGTWRVEYRQAGAVAEVGDVGRYDVHVTLENDSMYACNLTFAGENGLTVTKRNVALSVWDYDVNYGDAAFAERITRGEEGTAHLWWPAGDVLTADITAFLANLTLSVQKTDGTWTDSLDASFGCSDRGYPLKVTSDNANYAVNVVREGKLYVNPRPLRVTVTSSSGNFTIYEGASPRLTVHVNLDMDVSDAEFNQLNAAFGLSYKDSEGKTVEGTPTEVGVYTVELVQSQSDVLKNYRVQYAPVKLTIKSLSLPTNDSAFEVSGRFNTTETLTVEKGVNSRYGAAVASLSGYHVVTVYEVSNPVSAESGNITFRLAAPSNLRNTKVLYAEGDQWVQLDFVQEGEYVVFTQRTMAAKYVICAQREINWLLIGLIAGGVVLAVVVVVVVVVVSKARRNKKLAEDATKQVAAPTAKATAKPDEDEELDSFIEAFDETTVERELTPAERIALREKEEKYQQYKQRLARLRTSDRTLKDTLSGLGLDNNANEDEIIAKMIEADEARAKQVEEDLRREEEEAKARAEEEKKTVILERSDEVLEQKTFAPTLPDGEDDDDIDI